MRIHALTALLLYLPSSIIPQAALADGAQPAVVAEFVAAAREQVSRINMAAFRKISEAPGKAIIIDVREPDEFGAGHIPGAINIPRGVIEFRIWPFVGYPEHPDLATELYLYCGWGSRSILAAGSLQQLGLSRVIAVDMLLTDWQAAGYPLTEPEF